MHEDNHAFAEEMGLSYPLLSDPGKTVIDAYGVLSERGLFAVRSYFLVGRDGKLKWIAVNKGILETDAILNEIRNALQL